MDGNVAGETTQLYRSRRKNIPGRCAVLPSGHFQQNLELVEKLKDLAGAKSRTPAQFALAWMMAQGDDIVLIPGTKMISYLDEHHQACRKDTEGLSALFSQVPPSSAG
jgi:aryl-alcohol dehydrogenase-like predicted oxidoreductase